MPDIVATIPGANTCQTFDDLNSILGRQVNCVYLNFSFVFFLFQICFCFLLSSSKRSERSLFLWDWLILGGFGSEKDLVGAEELTAVVCPRIC